ncbi:hypothetical protein ABNE62_19745, partial [Paenibacillus larvae]
FRTTLISVTILSTKADKATIHVIVSMHITSDLFFTAIVLRLGWRGASPPKELLTFAWLAAFGSFFLFLLSAI